MRRLTAMRQLHLPLLAIAVAASACANANSIGETYELRTIGADSLPLVRPGQILGEDMRLQGATLTISPRGRLSARVELSVTDSSTVEVVTDAVGTWEPRGDSLF